MAFWGSMFNLSFVEHRATESYFSDSVSHRLSLSLLGNPSGILGMDLSRGSPPVLPQENDVQSCILLSALQSHAKVRGHQEAFFPKNREGLCCHPSQQPHNTHLTQGNSFI